MVVPATILEQARAAVRSADAAYADVRVDRHTLRTQSLREGGGGDMWTRPIMSSGLRLVDSRRATGFAAMSGKPDWRWLLQRSADALRSASGRWVARAPLPAVEPVDWTPAVAGAADQGSPERSDLEAIMARLRRGAAGLRIASVEEDALDGWRAFASNAGTSALAPVRLRQLRLGLQGAPELGRNIALSATGGSLEQLEAALRHLLSGLATPIAKGVASVDARRVVLSPSIAALLMHEGIGHASEADRIAAPQRWRAGLRIGSAEVTITDEPIGVPPTEWRHDDEGVAGRTVVLVEGGRWTSLLHTLGTAADFGTESTGNARASSAMLPPTARMRGLMVARGSASLAELLGEAEGGLFLDVPGGGVLRGATLQIIAYGSRRIRNGQLCESVGPVVLHADPIGVLGLVCGVGSDSEVVRTLGLCRRGAQAGLPVYASAPPLLLDRPQLSRYRPELQAATELTPGIRG